MTTTMNKVTIGNATLNSILSTNIVCKKKNATTGKYDQYTTTMLKDGFKHVPKSSDLTEEGKATLSALENCFKYLERTAVATTDAQRDKCATKAQEAAKAYLTAVGLSTGIGNITMLTGVFAPKKQTVKGEVKGGYTTKSTFIKYALYMAYHLYTTGKWCLPKSNKSTNGTTTKVFDYDAYAATLISFGMEEMVVAKMVQALKAQVAA